MENLIIESGTDRPEISMDVKSGIISIKGSSYPEDSETFYAPVMNWLNAYFADSPVDKTIINFELVYCNSASSKVFYDFFDILSNKCTEHNIEINWIYDEENDTAIEMAEDFMEDFENLSFNLIQK